MSYLNMKSFNPQKLLNESNINTSRNGLYYYEQQDTARILNTGTLTFTENRKFKLDIENKFKACRANETYSFPLKRVMNNSDDGQQDRELYIELHKVRFYNLNEQNERQAALRHKRSRSETSIRLFQKMIQQEKEEGLKKNNQAPDRFKTNQKDKENNLNFQNLLNKGREKEGATRGPCKPTPQPKNISIQNKTCIPKLNLQHKEMVFRQNSPIAKSPINKTASIKCFRDLLKLQNIRK